MFAEHTSLTPLLLEILYQYISERFQRFDFGVEKNLEVYNSTTPPQFPLSEISVPLSFFYGENDPFADPKVISSEAENYLSILDLKVTQWYLTYLKVSTCKVLWTRNVSPCSQKMFKGKFTVNL